jgi:hypothetical protein
LGGEVFEGSLDLYTNFHGVGVKQENSKDPAVSADGRIYWSVSCVPMWEIAHLPIKLKKEVKIYENFKDVVLEGEYSFSLLEVLDAIYDDISFYGSPEQSKQFIEKLNAETEKIKNGEVPLIPYEQVRKELGLENEENSDENKTKILFSPDVARQFGVDPNKIPLDDKEIIHPKDEQ